MSSIPSIELPGELIPADGRFGSGPSKVRTESLLELGVTGSSFMGTSHRQPGVKSVVSAWKVIVRCSWGCITSGRVSASQTNSCPVTVGSPVGGCIK